MPVPFLDMLFSNVFPWMKIIVLWFRFHCCLFLLIFISYKLWPSHKVSWGGRAQVVGRSLIGCKAAQVSRSSVTSVSRRSGRSCGFGTRVYADILMSGMRGSRARKSVIVRSQVTLITRPIIQFLLTCMSIAPVCQSLPDIYVNACLRSDNKSLATAHESKKYRISQLINRF